MRIRKLTVARLREVLNYCPDTGAFTWRIKTCRKVVPNTPAGRIDDHGYVRISIDRELYRAHQLVIAYVSGEFPAAQVDHINGNRADNRLANLRPATNAENARNSRRVTGVSGFRGVVWNARDRKWTARITVDYRPKHLGNFDTREAAHAAYYAAARALHGDFAFEAAK